jgi:hypothetical protein
LGHSSKEKAVRKWSLLIAAVVVVIAAGVYLLPYRHRLRYPDYRAWVSSGNPCTESIFMNDVIHDPLRNRLVANYPEKDVLARFPFAKGEETFPAESFQRGLRAELSNQAAYKGHMIDLYWPTSTWCIVFVDGKGSSIELWKP